MITTESMAKMHRDHVDTRREHLAWFDDIQRWKLEHLRLLGRLEAALAAHEDLLDSHGRAINRHARLVAEHEHLLFRTAHDGDESLMRGAAFLHEDMKDRHGVVRGEHATLKQHHRELMAALSRLIKEIEAETKQG